LHENRSWWWARQWGDEGKGKGGGLTLRDRLTTLHASAGGHNRGATRSSSGKTAIVLQLIPCGILRPKQQAVIGNGPPWWIRRRWWRKIATLSKAGIEVKGRLPRQQPAHNLIFPYHRELDKSRGRRSRRETKLARLPAESGPGLRRQNGAGGGAAHVRPAGGRSCFERKRRTWSRRRTGWRRAAVRARTIDFFA